MKPVAELVPVLLVLVVCLRGTAAADTNDLVSTTEEFLLGFKDVELVVDGV